MIKVTKNQSNSAIVSAGHNRLAELLQLPTKCRCNNLQNRFATTYKNILQFYAKSTCKKHIISSIHNDPEGWIIAGIIFLAYVWISGIMKIVRNKRKRRK